MNCLYRSEKSKQQKGLTEKREQQQQATLAGQRLKDPCVQGRAERRNFGGLPRTVTWGGCLRLRPEVTRPPRDPAKVDQSIDARSLSLPPAFVCLGWCSYSLRRSNWLKLLAYAAGSGQLKRCRQAVAPKIQEKKRHYKESVETTQNTRTLVERPRSSVD